MNECELCGKKTNWLEMKTLELCSECAETKGIKRSVDKIFIKSEEVINGFQNIILGKHYESDLDAILDMMDLYFSRKILTDKMMGVALRDLKRKQNPFIDKKIVDSMKKRAEEQGYTLSHEVFDIKLKNDIKKGLNDGN